MLIIVVSERNKPMNKIIFPKPFILSLAGVLLVTFNVWAGATAVEGVVKDPSGRPIKGADVRIEAKKFSKIVKTDTRGYYVSDGLAVGTYKVTLVINGQVKASILDAKTQVGKATQLNFDLTGKRASAKKQTQMLWIPSDNTAFSNVEKVGRPAYYGKDIIEIRPSVASEK
jgi:hypothetical protein